MLHCPRCSTPLSIGRCSACPPTPGMTPLAPLRASLPLSGDLTGGVIQYPPSRLVADTTAGTAARHAAPGQSQCASRADSLVLRGSQSSGDLQDASMFYPPQPISMAGLAPSSSSCAMSSHHHQHHQHQQQQHQELQHKQQQLEQQIQMLQLQMQNARLKHELDQMRHMQHHHHQPLQQSHSVPPRPLSAFPLLTSTVSCSPASPSLCSFSAPPTPAILVGSAQPPLVAPGVPWPVFTPPPEIPLPAPVADTARILADTQAQLAECGWYYPGLSWQESSMLLQDTSEGTFLVRDSQDPRFLYSLSVQRAKDGPTSVRIVFSCGRFRLDAEERIRDLMPSFGSVGELVQYHVSLSGSKSSRQVFVDQADTNKMHSPIVLRHPLYKKTPSLAHLCRLSINTGLQAAASPRDSAEKQQKQRRKQLESLDLPVKLVDFIDSYALRV